MKIEIRPHEIEMIFAMDDAYLSASGEEQRDFQARSQSQKPKAKRTR